MDTVKGVFNVTFLRSMASTNSFTDEVAFVNGSKQAMIYAYGSSRPSSSSYSASIQQHGFSSRAEVPPVNLFLSPGSSSSDNNVVIDGGGGGSSYRDKIIAHGVLMVNLKGYLYYIRHPHFFK